MKTSLQSIKEKKALSLFINIHFLRFIVFLIMYSGGEKVCACECQKKREDLLELELQAVMSARN